jgi:hypothetical protein
MNCCLDNSTIPQLRMFRTDPNSPLEQALRQLQSKIAREEGGGPLLAS